MIPLSVALNCLASLDERHLRAAVGAAIFDGRHVGALGIRDVQPEDVFIPVLAAPDAPQRAAIVAGCRDVCVQFFSALSELSAGEEAGKQDLAEAAEHFSALLGAAKPPELAAQVRGLLETSLEPAIDKTVREPLVRLAVSFAALDPRPEYWQDHLQGDRIPGHAFQALRRIDPHHPRLEGFLSHLWQRSLRGELSLRVPFYVQTWAKEQPSAEEAIHRVLRATVSAAPDLREALRADCARYQHSAAWAGYLSDFAVAAPSRTIKRSSSNVLVARSRTARTLTPWLDQLYSDVKASIVNLDTQGVDFVLPKFATESFQMIAPSGLQLSNHLFVIRNPTDVTSDEVVKTTLKRFGTNLVTQIGMIPLQQSKKARA